MDTTAPSQSPTGLPNSSTTPQHISCDVLVVGAGSAGVMAARMAAATGAQVVLIESSPLPRRKSCGGMLNKYAQEALAALGALPTSMILDPAWVHFRYYDWDRGIKKPCSLRFCNVDRVAFDDWLIDQLPTSVHIMDHTAYVSSTQNADGVVARAQQRDSAVEIACRWLIGADGARSAVRRDHPTWPQTSCYKTVQEFVHIEPGSIEPYFDCIYSRHIAPAYGYGYIVPKGDLAIVGSVFFPGTKNIPPMHERALELFGERYPLGSSVRREAGVALQVRSPRDIIAGEGRILMAGEAAGLMSPSSGEGISFALNSGALAGRAVASAYTGQLGRTSPTVAIDAYEQTLAPLRKNIAFRLRFFPIMNSSWGKWLGGCMPTALVSKITERL